MATTIASNQGAAQSAASAVTGVSVGQGATASISESNISAMTTGADVANRMVSDIANFADSVKTQANKFPQLADAMSMRDSQVSFNVGSGAGGGGGGGAF